MKKKSKIKGIDLIISAPVGIFVSRAASKIFNNICNKYHLGSLSYAGNGLLAFFIGINAWGKISGDIADIRNGIIYAINVMNGTEEEENGDSET